MRATKFEFEYRFFFVGAIFFIGFSLSNFDRVNAGVALLHFLAPSINPDSSQGTFLLRVIFGSGALLVFFAALFRTWATAYLRTEVVHDAPLHSEALLADGPYRFVRNPLYFALLPMTAGIGLLASRAGWVFLVLAIYAFQYRLILREESELLQTQGESYRAYLAAVPRWWPALTARLPSGGSRPRWGQAIAGEMFIWLMGLAQLCFALTLNLKLSGAVFASSFVVYFIAVSRVKKRAAQSGSS